MKTAKLCSEFLQRRSAFVLSEPIQGLIEGLLLLIPALWTEEFFILDTWLSRDLKLRGWLAPASLDREDFIDLLKCFFALDIA